MQTRRDFLKLASAALATGALPFFSRADSRSSSISLGFSLYGMKTLPISTAFSECARIGYRNVELALMTGFPTEPASLTLTERRRIVARLTELNLTASSLLVNITLVGDDRAHEATLETIKFAGELAHDFKNPPVIQTVMGGKPEAWDALKDSMADRLHSWGTTAASVNATIAVKAHVTTAVNSPERLLWIVKQAANPAVAVAYDHSHFELAGISMKDSWRMLAPYTRFVHVKEAVREGKDVRFLLPGEGTTNYRDYFNLLQGAGYAGPVVVEVSSKIFSKPGYDPIEAAEKSYSALAGPLAVSTGIHG